MTKKWLAFDIGTTETKAALVTDAGKILRSAGSGYPTHTGSGGVTEQDAAAWWRAVCQTSRELDAHDEAEAIALTGQMQNVILLRDDGGLTRPVILYSDTRAHAEAERVTEKLGAEKLRDETGNDQDAGSLLAKLLWLSVHEPASIRASRWLLSGAADYIALQMTGVAATDTTTASTTGLMHLPSRSPLDQSIFEQLGLGDCRRLLPPFVSGGQCIGELTDTAAAELGLCAGVPVHCGLGDAGATTLGSGSGEIGTAYGYLGTSGWIAFTAAQGAPPGQGVLTLAHPNPALYIQVAPLLTAGGNLEWVRNLFSVDDYDTVIAEALSSPPSSLLYLPYLRGERSPFSDPHVRGAFVGLQMDTRKRDLYRAVLEGVALAYRHALDSLAPDSTKTLTLTGGGARSWQWSQLFSDILGIPVALSDDAGNVGVRGAVLAAQIADGEQTRYTPPDFAAVKVLLQPNTAYAAHYDAQYGLFRALYPALKDIFGKMV